MKRQGWDDPVRIKIRHPGRHVIINSTESAAQYMFEEPPGDRSTTAFQAVARALFDAVDEKLPVNDAPRYIGR
ncbi:DUF982 domain-containing protein [Rhizobium sp. BR 317]|uniref:hypothetical protein n=1 Tax=Rhizobium sp. BR 317 TaxID=3040015 RepID=UPI0039BEE5AF